MNFQKTCASVLRDNSHRLNRISVAYIAPRFAGSRMWFVLAPKIVRNLRPNAGLRIVVYPIITFPKASKRIEPTIRRAPMSNGKSSA